MCLFKISKDVVTVGRDIKAVMMMMELGRQSIFHMEPLAADSRSFFPTLLTPIIACAESILNLVKYCHILEFGFNPFPYPFAGLVAYTAALHYITNTF